MNCVRSRCSPNADYIAHVYTYKPRCFQTENNSADIHTQSNQPYQIGVGYFLPSPKSVLPGELPRLAGDSPVGVKLVCCGIPKSKEEMKHG